MTVKDVLQKKECCQPAAARGLLAGRLWLCLGGPLLNRARLVHSYGEPSVHQLRGKTGGELTAAWQPTLTASGATEVWGRLPEHLLAQLFSHLLDAGRLTHYSVW